MITIAVTIQKGGTGKTITALTTADILANCNNRVLLVDLDTQATATRISRLDDIDNDVIDVLTKQKPITQSVYITRADYDVLPNSTNRSVDELKTKNNLGVNNALKESLDVIADYYDYCIIDAPPALNTLTINALTAADYCVIPAKPDGVHVDGTIELLNTVKEVQKYTNNKLQVAGALMTHYHANTILHKTLKQLLGDIMEQNNSKVFDATIRNVIAISETYTKRKLLSEYAPKSKVYNDYKMFVNELLDTIGEGE